MEALIPVFFSNTLYFNLSMILRIPTVQYLTIWEKDSAELRVSPHTAGEEMILKKNYSLKKWNWILSQTGIARKGIQW